MPLGISPATMWLNLFEIRIYTILSIKWAITLKEHFISFLTSSKQSQFSRVWLFVTPWAAAPRVPCPSPSPGVCSNSCPLSQRCHLTISSSVVPFSACLQSFPILESFPMSQLFASGGLSIWNFSFNISPSSEYWGLIFFRIHWFELLTVQGTLKSLL